MPFVKSDLQGHTILCGDNWFSADSKRYKSSQGQSQKQSWQPAHGATNIDCAFEE